MNENLIATNQKEKKIKDKILLEWSNINYTISTPVVKNKKSKVEVQENFNKDKSSNNLNNENSYLTNPAVNENEKIILNNVEGFARPNELLVIMGPSGCGKTSLLNIIASRQLSREKDHKITREVKANNIQMDDSNFGKICAYVMQDDILLECLTPRESLYFGAKLKLRTSEQNINKRVDRLIIQFGLEKCADSRIGSVIQKGISGGERKRTSIAYEVISNPPIVIVDEPTTGMDSFTSLVIIKYLKQMAMTGKTIVCTIHQPSSEIFNYIDRLILLKDGQLVYQGKAEYSLKYFEAIGCVMPQFCNPFDFFLDVVSDDTKTIKSLNQSYNKLCDQEVREERVKLHEEYKTKDILTIKENLRQVSWCLEFWLIFKRTMMENFRNKKLLITRILSIFFMTLIIMGFYWDIGADTKKDLLFQNYLGFFFNDVSSFFVNGLFGSLYTIPNIKTLLKREYSAKLYRLSSFYTAFSISLLCTSLITPLIYSPLAYSAIQLYMTDLDSNLKVFFTFFAINFFTYSLGQYFGLLIGGSFPESATFIVSPFVFIIFMLGAGVYRGNDSLPGYIRWFMYISPYKYILELSLKNFSQFNEYTKVIPEILNFDYGYAVTIPTLAGILVLTLLLGFLGLRKFTAKF